MAGKHADIYALWGETQAQVRETISRVRAAAAKWGRSPRFSLSLRPVLADTEEGAWKRAREIEDRTRELREKAGLKTSGHTPPNAGSQRLLAAAAQGSRLDKRLWAGVAALTGAAGNSTGLVGTPDQVAEAMLDYYDLGVTTFLIRGFDPLEDAIAYGRDLIPLVRGPRRRPRRPPGRAPPAKASKAGGPPAVQAGKRSLKVCGRRWRRTAGVPPALTSFTTKKGLAARTHKTAWSSRSAPAASAETCRQEHPCPSTSKSPRKPRPCANACASGCTTNASRPRRS